jgi:predicted nuclease with TOPRIM domain
MQELQKLGEKLDLLLKKYGELQAENTRLKKTVSDQLKEMEQLNKKFASLEDNMASVQLGKSVLTVNDKIAVTRQIDTVIGDIDKILATLND